MEHLSTEQILRAIDGVIEPSEQGSLKTHLAACALCRKEMEIQQAIAWSMKSQPLVEPSAAFTSQVMAQVAPQRRSVISLQWIYAAAACLVVMIGSYVFLLNAHHQVVISNTKAVSESAPGTISSGVANLSEDISTGVLHTLTAYLQSGNGKMFALIMFSFGVLFLFDRILSRRFSALHR